jgi:glycosyltransferase involved in cell wall biosynthesis
VNILWLPHAPWHIPQRARFFAETLSERHNVWVTDWDGDFAKVSSLFSKRYLLNTVPRRWQEKGVKIAHVPRLAPALFFKGLRLLNTRLYRQALERLIREEHIDVVVGCFVAPVPEHVALVTDIFDDNVGLWLAHGANKAYAQEIQAGESAWVNGSQHTVAVSSVLGDKLRKDYPNANLVHIPNGVDLRAYQPNRVAARQALGLSTSMTYVGNIGALDNGAEAERILAVARALRNHKGVEILVVGKGNAVSYLEQTAAQQGLTNLRFVGFVTGQTLLHYFQALDIGLCPYEDTPADAARVPMRLLHYSAVGAKVVCTGLEEVKRMKFENVLLTSNDKTDFAAKVVEALELPPQVPQNLPHYDLSTLTQRYEAVLATSIKMKKAA